YRASRLIPLKQTTDDAIKDIPFVKRVIVLRRTAMDIPWTEGRDHWWHDQMKGASAECPAEPMDAEDPLFILYTSGSTGKPKGVMHTTAGYLIYVSLTHELIFDIRDDDTYWCTADIGWVTRRCPARSIRSPVPRRSRFSGSSQPLSTIRARSSPEHAPETCASRGHGQESCAACTATPSGSTRRTSPPSRDATSRVTGVAATRTAITGSPAASTT